MTQLTIGVTGHRDIHPKAYDKVKQLAKLSLDEVLGVTPSKEITLISPLAAGADQLLAELAIQKGISLHVPLPFPIERYVLDFASRDRSRFLTLCEKADKVFVPAIVNDQTSEEACYFAVGAYVAQHSHVLIGFWNGQTSPEKTGGTNHIIRCQFQGFPNSMRVERVISHRKTFWIRTPRSTDKLFTPTGNFLTDTQFWQHGNGGT